MYNVFRVIGLWAIYSSWFCKFTCSKLEAPHLGCKNELVGDQKKNVLALVWVELMWYTVYCSSLLPFFFFLENKSYQTNSWLKHSNPVVHHCSTVQTKIIGLFYPNHKIFNIMCTSCQNEYLVKSTSHCWTCCRWNLASFTTLAHQNS